MTIREWLRSHSGSYVSRVKLFADCQSEMGAARRSVQRAYAQEFNPRYSLLDKEVIEDGRDLPAPFSVEDMDLIAENVRLRKQSQRLQDTNRVERKAFRESARIENTIESMEEELIKILRENRFHFKPPAGAKTRPRGKISGIIHISDTHFNELVSMKMNRYDFEVASRRLRWLCLTAVEQFRKADIRDVYLVLGGDMLNSDRRLDEKMAMAAGRMQATYIGTDLLQQFIAELMREGFFVHLLSVSGNESRIDQEQGYTLEMMSDNLDFVIHNLLKFVFLDTESIEVMDGDPAEQPISVQGNIILCTHGNFIKGADLGKAVAKTVSRYTVNHDIKLDYILMAHRHVAMISDFWAVNGSMVGLNAYGDIGLQVLGRASQNIFFVREGDIRGMRVDLQSVDGVTGYDYSRSMEAYNTKSSAKLRTPVVLHSTVLI